MITFIQGMLVGIGAAIIIQIGVNHVSHKRDMEIVDGIIDEDEPYTKESFDDICDEIFIDSVLNFCKRK